MGKSTGSKTPFWHQTPSKKGTWPTSHQPSKSTSQPICRSLRRSHWGNPAPLKNSLPTKRFFKSSTTSLLSIISKCQGWIRPFLNKILIPGLTWHLFVKKNGPSIFPKVLRSKPKIEKLRTAGFIYPIAYTTWVSNPIPMNKI